MVNHHLNKLITSYLISVDLMLSVYPSSNHQYIRASHKQSATSSHILTIE